MTGDEVLAAIMDVIRAELPLPETRIEIGKILDRFGQAEWERGLAADQAARS